jgi:hypothetical protein
LTYFLRGDKKGGFVSFSPVIPNPVLTECEESYSVSGILPFLSFPRNLSSRTRGVGIQSLIVDPRLIPRFNREDYRSEPVLSTFDKLSVNSNEGINSSEESNFVIPSPVPNGYEGACEESYRSVIPNEHEES